MIDPTPNEQAAMIEGGKAGGTYLESIGKTDLVTLTEAEWNTFVEAVVTGFCDHLRTVGSCNVMSVNSAGRGVGQPTREGLPRAWAPRIPVFPRSKGDRNA